MHSSWIVLAVVSVGLTAFTPKKAAAGEVRSQIEHLLTLATEPSAKNLQAVEDYYRSLPAARRDDRAVQYAYALALIRQRHLTESAEWIARLTQEQPQLELQATDIKHQSDLGKLAVKEQALEKNQKRVENDTRRLKAKPLGSSPRLRVEAAQLTNFSTYIPFPFEREKERLLSEAR